MKTSARIQTKLKITGPTGNDPEIRQPKSVASPHFPVLRSGRPTPISPPSSPRRLLRRGYEGQEGFDRQAGPTQRLFQGPPAQSKLLAIKFLAAFLPVLILLLALAPITGVAAGKDEKPSNGLIITFNGEMVDGVEADTKKKEFKPVFEKELARIAEKLDGKAEMELIYWYTVINGCAIRATKGDEKTLQQLKTTLEKLPYVKHVEYDIKVQIDLPK